MSKQTLGVIGAGAFGAFMLPHLTPHYDVSLFDAHTDIVELARTAHVKAVDFKTVSTCDIVVIAVPVQQMEGVMRELAPFLKPGALVIDVASVKIKPTDWMNEILPANVDAIGLHPLFGPQSGKNGIEGLNIVVCNVRGQREANVVSFLRDTLKLSVFVTTPQDHDKQLAYVQGLTHLIAKVIVALDLPKFDLTTKTFDYMLQAVEMVRYDSDELFKAIERENPFTSEAKDAFFSAARKLEEKLARD